VLRLHIVGRGVELTWHMPELTERTSFYLEICAMKKLLIVTAIVMLTSSTVGCKCCRWLWRGDSYNQCTPVCAPVCPPVCPTNPCDPCATPSVQPGPASYAPAIVQ
jgi:hypothetical protein